MTRLFGVLPRRAAVVPLAACLIALVAACDSGTRQVPPTAPPNLHPPLTQPPSTAPTNQELAVRETRRLVVLANLPPASTPIFAAPDNLVEPVSVPSGSSLVDAKRFWRVDMGLADARHWVAKHPPVGLHPAGTSGGVMSGSPTVYGYKYTDRDSKAWTGANLQIAIVAAGQGTTFWRVDAMALWLDDKPVQVSPGGRRLSFTVQSGCPTADHGAVSVPPSGRGHRLLPVGQPAEALVCRYSGTGDLTSHTRLFATGAAHLGDLAAGVSLGHVDNQVIHCTMDNGTRMAIAFRFSDGADGELWYRASGCPAIDNGTVFVGVGRASDALFAALAKLAKGR